LSEQGVVVGIELIDESRGFSFLVFV